jgi:hypothetical protein
MEKANKYNFSFTAASLRINEMILVAKSMFYNTELDFTNELGAGKKTTGNRMLKEFHKRLLTLTRNELDLLINGDLNSQKKLAFLSICKSQKFIRDFVVEVLREKVLVFDYQLSEGDYISFYRRKAEIHPDMDKLSEATVSKIKQVTFKILEQAGMIDSIKSKSIQPQILDSIIINEIALDNKEWLKIFFMSDLDIENIK